jgi:hypothetical protein
VCAGQIVSTPHRAWRDATAEKFNVQLIELPLDSGSSSLRRHLPGGNAATPRLEHAISRWPSAAQPSTSSCAG